MNQETETYEMSMSEIAAQLRISEKTVHSVLQKALANSVHTLSSVHTFCAAVREKRRALDARPGNGPWHCARRLKLSAQEE